MEFHLYLKSPKAAKATPIRVRIYLKAQPHHYSTGESIYPDAWDFEQQRCKTGVRFPFGANTNIRIKKVVSAVEIVYSRFQTDGAHPTWEQFKAAVDKQLERNVNQGEGFWKYVHDFIEGVKRKRPELSQKPSRNNLLNNYSQTYKLLQHYQKGRKTLDFDVFTESWFDKFVEYLLPMYAPNTVGKHIKNLKTWLNAATLDGVNTNLKYKRYKVMRERSEEIFLTADEIASLNGVLLTGKDAETRDIFVFACYTGLRYVDFAQVVKTNIHSGSLFLRQTKTDQPVIIPLRPECMDILNRYGGELPECPTNQAMNRKIKEIGILAGIDPERCKEIKVHTARRSFATNLYLEGFPAYDIMKITGHRTEKSFLLYIRIAPADTARRLREFWAK